MRIGIPISCLLFSVPLSMALAADQSPSSLADRQKPYFALLKA
jgi:hypothetical protein